MRRDRQEASYKQKTLQTKKRGHRCTGARASIRTGRLRPDFLTHRNGRKPVVTVRLAAIEDAEKLFANCLRDGTNLSVGNSDFVDRANRRDLRGGAGEEDFVGDVEKFTGNDCLDHRNAEILGHPRH
jgi:hypothetical protein